VVGIAIFEYREVRIFDGISRLEFDLQKLFCPDSADWHGAILPVLRQGFEDVIEGV